MSEKQWLNTNNNVDRVDSMTGYLMTGYLACGLNSGYKLLSEQDQEAVVDNAISLLMKIDERAGVYERTKTMEDVGWTYNSN